MKYHEINDMQKKHIMSQCSTDLRFDWQEQNIIEIFMGVLPELRYTNTNEKIASLVWELEKIYHSYNPFETDANTFIRTLNEKNTEITILQPDWFCVDLYSVEQYVKMHQFCLISGEGGIGKSFFVKELEEALTEQAIPHLCIYGKSLKDIDQIDFDEIRAEEKFVFVVDALNEMSPSGQQNLVDQLKQLKINRGCRIIVTYRTHRISAEILEQYKSLSPFEYEFQGVSFESSLDCLTRQEVPNVHLYEDILYSNNPLYLTILAKTLSAEKMANHEINHELKSLTSITNIFEQYVKKTLNSKMWQKTKTLAEWMYLHNTKAISLSDLGSVIEDGRHFFEEMQQRGFMSIYSSRGAHFCYFSIETLSDFLIARALMRNLPNDNIEGQISLLKEKLDAFPSFAEAFILILFDRFAPDYKHIRFLMEQTGLQESFQKDTLLKIIFPSENIVRFQESFTLTAPLNNFETFAGYTNQPFNCTNHMNTLLLKREFQLQLSSYLEGKHFHSNVVSRLKNILYTLNTINTTPLRIKEAFWFALWCCAAPNEIIRRLAIKLLFDVIYSNPEYRMSAISVFPQIYDHYIQESIILVLSYCPKDSSIEEFFRRLIDEPTFLLSRSLKRIAVYMGVPYGYIEWKKENVRDDAYSVSDTIQNLTSHIDLVDQYFFPFSWQGINHISMRRNFLDVDKSAITSWNSFLNQNFSCITKNSCCCGSLRFEKNAESLFGMNYSNEQMDAMFYYKAMAKIAANLLDMYPVKMKDERYIYSEFANSLIKKCFSIANDIVMGSFMCNFYSNQFSTHNTEQDTLGYEVYDPFEYEEQFPVTTPIPNYSSAIDEMNDVVAERIELPDDKDKNWAKNIDLSRKNLAILQQPVPSHGQEWIMIAGRINLRENDGHHNLLWKDTYILWCCTSPKTTLIRDGNERYLTIELEEYRGALGEYNQSQNSPHLCKCMPSLGSSDFNVLDESSLVLPPASLIKDLKLTINQKNMTWTNETNDIVLFCNNVKYSYYTSPSGCTIFMRKDIYEEYIREHTLKFFAFAERYHHETGYADETSIHFEIEKGRIKKEIPNNHLFDKQSQEEIDNGCCDCPHGFFESLSEVQDSLPIFHISYEDDLED